MGTFTLIVEGYIPKSLERDENNPFLSFYPNQDKWKFDLKKSITYDMNCVELQAKDYQMRYYCADVNCKCSFSNLEDHLKTKSFGREHSINYPISLDEARKYLI